MAIKLYSISEERAQEKAAPAEPVPTVGEILKKRRIEKNLKIPELATELCIKRSYLTDIENSNYKELPEAIYTVGFIKSYALRLGLDAPAMVEQFRKEAYGNQPRDEFIHVPQNYGGRMLPSRVVVACSLILALMVYGYWHYTNRYEPKVEVVAENINEETVSTENASTSSTQATESQEVTESQVAQGMESSDITPPSEESIVASSEVSETPVAEITASPEGIQGTSDGSALQAGESVTTPPPAALVLSGAIKIRAKHETWVQIGDGEKLPLLSKVMQPGEVFNIPADQPNLKLLTADASGLEIFIGDQVVENAATYGQILRNVQLDPAVISQKEIWRN